MNKFKYYGENGFNLENRFISVSFGGGVNSTAILLGFHERGIKPNLITFSDTGAELPITYRHVQEVSDWCESVGFPKIEIVKYKKETLENECLRRETLPSLAFGYKTCSQKYKRAPMDSYFNKIDKQYKIFEKYGKVVYCIGYDFDEWHRIKEYDNKKYENYYPLVDWCWNRQKCEEKVKEYGFTAHKSSCFFCPAMKKHEVLRLKKENPELFQRAILMERNAIKKTVKGLGRNWSWEELQKADDNQLKLFSDESFDIGCGCMNG